MSWPAHRTWPSFAQIVLQQIRWHHDPMRILFFAAALIATSVQGQTISGSAEIIDGDSLWVSGISVRLFGIEAPEGKQTCNRWGSAWSCGEEAATQLRTLIDGNPIECRGRDIDTYGRTLAVCSVADIEIKRAMVEAG